MLDKPQIIEFPKIKDSRGNLTFFEFPNQIPFEIKRTYWIYDVPGGELRGGHAFKSQSEIIVALSGSFEVKVNNGFEEQCFTLNRANFGLLVPKLHWRSIENFSTNALALVISNFKYDEDDYIRSHNKFKSLVDV